MDWKEFLDRSVVAVVLLATICAIVIVTLKSGSEALAATGLKDLAILVAGGLLGLKTPKP